MININKRILLVFLLILTITLISIYFSQENRRETLERNSLEKMLSKMIERQRSGEIQYIDFSQLTYFAWDQLYVIEPYMTLDNLPLDNCSINSLPVSIESNDGIVLFIFMQDGQVVQYLEFGREKCDFADSGRMWPYSRDDARFIINDKNRCIPFQ